MGWGGEENVFFIFLSPCLCLNVGMKTNERNIKEKKRFGLPGNEHMLEGKTAWCPEPPRRAMSVGDQDVGAKPVFALLLPS